MLSGGSGPACGNVPVRQSGEENSSPNEDKRKTGFPKEMRLGRKCDFDAVKETGRRTSDRLFTLLTAPYEKDFEKSFPVLGVICSRKFHKRAVVRNRARRIVKEAFRLLQEKIGPCRMIVIPRREISRVGMTEVKSHMETALAKAGLLRDAGTVNTAGSQKSN